MKKGQAAEVLNALRQMSGNLLKTTEALAKYRSEKSKRNRCGWFKPCFDEVVANVMVS